VQTSRPGGKFMAKIRNFDSFGGCITTHFCPDKGEIWHGGAPLPRAKFHVYRGNVSSLRGEKPILDHWVKTIPAWLRFAQACR